MCEGLYPSSDGVPITIFIVEEDTQYLFGGGPWTGVGVCTSCTFGDWWVGYGCVWGSQTVYGFGVWVKEGKDQIH